MSLKIGIVGLPNVGKSTLFNALTRSKQADAQNYPFCTIEPNVGVVEVPDERLAGLAAVSHSARVIPAAIEFVDIAGLVKGASEGAGLGNKFLSHIREVDAIAQVVRAFTDDNVIHVQNRVDPKEDGAIVNLELVLADWQTVAKRLASARKSAKGAAAKDYVKELALLTRLDAHLQAGRVARQLTCDEDEMKVMRELHLLTMKPLMYVVNVDEPSAVSSAVNNEQLTSSKKLAESGETIAGGETVIEAGAPHIYVCARLEAELADLSVDEAREYMKGLGVMQSGLDKIILAGYELLKLITYFTSGEPETRAWTVRRGTVGPEAAGVIHTDFIKGYIKADVTNWQDFVSFDGWVGVREHGKLRIEGKEYAVQDGDVCYFHVAT